MPDELQDIHVTLAVAARQAARGRKDHQMSVFFRGELTIAQVFELHHGSWAEARARMAEWQAQASEQRGARPTPWTDALWLHTWGLLRTELERSAREVC